MTDYTPNLTDSQLYKAAHNMERIGGSFASAIAQAYFVADGDNRKRLLCAFGDLFEKFNLFNQGESK